MFFDDLLRPYYETDKDDTFKDAVNWQWFYTLLTLVSSMFKREGLPEEIDERVIEPYLLLTGCGAYVKEGDKYIFGRCTLGGEPDRYYRGKNAIVTAGGGYCKVFEDWLTNPDIVVCWNAPTRTPDFQLWKTAGVLTEVDLSLLCNLIYSRLYPIGVAQDDKTKKTLEQLYANMKVGKFASITSKNIFDSISGKDGTGVDVLNLTDVTVSDKIQYLAKYRDDLMRWLWSMYGQNVQATSKLAQESVAESTSGEGVSMILPHTMYHERLRECEELNKKFGWNVTVNFTEPWQNSFADCYSEDEGPETAEDEPTEGKEEPENENRKDNDSETTSE